MEKIKCKNCESILNGKFCSNCGQKIYSERDKSLSNISEEVLHFMTHFEGKLFNTLKVIYLYPGKLSLDYSSGIRQKYYKPISLYLLIVILYFTTNRFKIFHKSSCASYNLINFIPKLIRFEKTSICTLFCADFST